MCEIDWTIFAFSYVMNGSSVTDPTIRPFVTYDMSNYHCNGRWWTEKGQTVDGDGIVLFDGQVVQSHQAIYQLQ